MTRGVVAVVRIVQKVECRFGASFMRNRRLTLAFPPYSISSQSSQRLSSRYPSSVGAEACSNSRKELELQSKLPNMISNQDQSEWLEVDLEDWFTLDRFLPLSSK